MHTHRCLVNKQHCKNSGTNNFVTNYSPNEKVITVVTRPRIIGEQMFPRRKSTCPTCFTAADK